MNQTRRKPIVNDAKNKAFADTSLGLLRECLDTACLASEHVPNKNKRKPKEKPKENKLTLSA
jgi:hypothetical protein